MLIKAGGTAFVIGKNKYRAWFDFLNSGDYDWSMREFDNEADAEEYGARVADRYNRIFGEVEA